MSSGSLKQFLKKTKKNHKTMNEKVWMLLFCLMRIDGIFVIVDCDLKYAVAQC